MTQCNIPQKVLNPIRNIVKRTRNDTKLFCFILKPRHQAINAMMKSGQKEKIVGQSVEELPWGWFSIWRQPSRRSPPSGKQGSQDNRDDHYN